MISNLSMHFLEAYCIVWPSAGSKNSRFSGTTKFYLTQVFRSIRFLGDRTCVGHFRCSTGNIGYNPWDLRRIHWEWDIWKLKSHLGMIWKNRAKTYADLGLGLQVFGWLVWRVLGFVQLVGCRQSKVKCWWSKHFKVKYVTCGVPPPRTLLIVFKMGYTCPPEHCPLKSSKSRVPEFKPSQRNEQTWTRHLHTKAPPNPLSLTHCALIPTDWTSSYPYHRLSFTTYGTFWLSSQCRVPPKLQIWKFLSFQRSIRVWDRLRNKRRIPACLWWAFREQRIRERRCRCCSGRRESNPVRKRRFPREVCFWACPSEPSNSSRRRCSNSSYLRGKKRGGCFRLWLVPSHHGSHTSSHSWSPAIEPAKPHRIRDQSSPELP